MSRFVIVALCALLVGGCLGHSTPPPGWTNAVTAPGRIQTFVDANGTFFPDDWRSEDVIGETRFRDADSLLNAVAIDAREGQRRALHAYEARWLDTFDAAVEGRKRVFVLIHGFNDEAGSARRSYALVQDNLDLRPEDVVVEFYWDGLTSWGGPLRKMVGSGRIWFWATGYSQVAGSRGLRRLLSRIENADVYLISHSRGASVSLSALSNPSYDPDFVAGTEPLLCPDGDARPVGAPPCPPGFLQPAALADTGNRYHLLMMAPAIGNPDFWGPASSTSSAAAAPPRFRELSPWPLDVRYTVNPLDPVLKKYFSPLSAHYNATDLGHDPAVGRRLSERYPTMSGYLISDREHDVHDFGVYVRCDVVVRMFADAGIGRRRPRDVDGGGCAFDAWPS